MRRDKNIMEIKKVSLIGLGALGTLFGNQLAKNMPREDLRIVADEDRIERYEKNKIYCNCKICDFNYVTPMEQCEPADLLIFTVKYNGLKDAIKSVKNHVGENTIILSALNGITSETVIGETYGMDKIIYCVAQGMDAVKVGNKLTYHNMGMLCFGENEPGFISERVKTVARFFEKTSVPYEAVTDMQQRLWGKFMLNVGINQTVAVYQTNYGGVQKEGEARDTMISAMREVIDISGKEGINLTEDDLIYWLKIVNTLNGKGKPSMAQDMEAKRFSEVELFSGAVLQFGKKHNIATPVNQMLYDKIKTVESRY